MTRKLLLCLFALAIVLSTVAQKAKRQNVVQSKHVSVQPLNFVENEVSTSAAPATALFKREPKFPSTIGKTLIGSSRNIFGSLLCYQTCLTYNEDIKDVMFTYRGNDKGTIVPFGTGNDIVTSTSVDKGATFVQKMAMSNGLGNRYTSGVFYNPTGNTDTANAYRLVAGPITLNSVWSGMYLHSEKYDGTGADHQEFPTDATFLELMRNGLTATGDGKFHISANGTTLNSAQTGYTACELFDLNGEWSSGTNKVVWDPIGSITPNLVAAPSTGLFYLDGAYSKAAWAKDGSVGYILMLGADNRPADKPSVTPIIWKSTNGGSTWTILDYFNWSTVPAIRNSIYPINVDTSIYKPYFEEASIVLDMNNKPHVFGVVRGASSANLDSLNYIWTRASTGTVPDGNIIELYMDENNAWQGNWIDSISADAVPYTKSPYVNTPNNQGWDHRLNGAISNDGTKVFCSWTDSDWIFWGTEAYDLNPDIKVWGRDISTTTAPYGPINVTANTDLWGLAFFHFFSPVVITTATGYSLPFTITDINTSGLQAQEPVYHYYVTGAEIITTGINDQTTKNTVRASACYPNPFTGTTSIDVTITKPVSATISVYDITGKAVSSTSYGTLNAGKTTLTIDGSKLHSGVYLYTLTIGDQKFNNKMIVK